MMEIGSDDRISFLDVTLIVENGIITFDLYKKPTPEDISIFSPTIL